MTCKLLPDERYLVSQGETYIETCDLFALILDFKCEVKYPTQHKSDCVAHTECYQIHTSQKAIQKLLGVTDCSNTSEVKELLLHMPLQSVKLHRSH